MLFVAFTGEEAGLLGSAHFVKNSPVPLAKITAMLNLDMVGRVQTQRLYIGGAGTAEPFETILAEADARSPLELATMSKGGLGPSDHMSFAQKKIPVLFFFSGLHRDYHLPSDDADKINHAALEQVIDLTDDVLLKLLTMPRAEYVSRFDGRDMRLGGGSGNRVTLGVIPDYGDDGQMKGVRISGTVANSPAATAGLREGDVIVKFGDYRIDSLYALTDALSSAQAGQVVQLIILRDGQPVELKATLAERR